MDRRHGWFAPARRSPLTRAIFFENYPAAVVCDPRPSSHGRAGENPRRAASRKP